MADAQDTGSAEKESDPLQALVREAVQALHASVARQQQWYTLHAAVTVQAINQLWSGAAGAAGDSFLRSVVVALAALDGAAFDRPRREEAGQETGKETA
jgi:hypothetical protein